MTSPQISAFPPEDAPKNSKACSETGRPFVQGEKVYSIILDEPGAIVRRDMCAEAWKKYKRPENALAWWQSRANLSDDRSAGTLAPNDALASLFVSLADKPGQEDLRYALALLLARRRVFRFEFDESDSDATDGSEKREAIYVYSPKNESGYVVPVPKMDETRIADVQERLLELISAPSASAAEEAERGSAEPGQASGRTAEEEAEVAEAALAAAMALSGEVE